MLKYFLILNCLFYLGINQIHAQNHVTWNFSYDTSSEKIIIKGAIDKGWHLYSQKTPLNAGPIPTTVHIDKIKGVKLIGNYSEDLVPHEIFDLNFDSKVYLFEDSYLSSQKIKCKNIKQITGKIEYMVCDDTRCMPPIEVPFTITIN
jgi:thiol:disulfide interchange protein DsbD